MPAVRKNRLSVEVLAQHHILVVDAQIAAEEVEYLALTRYPHAQWVDDEVLQLSRHSSLQGPVTIDARVAAELGLDTALTQPSGVDVSESNFQDLVRGEAVSAGRGQAGREFVAYIASCPVERGDSPLPGVGDRDGISRAFPSQMPYREEGRIVDWLVAVARRLGGAVRMSGTGVILRPDPATSVDLTVHTDVWLDPEAALAVIRQVLPTAFIDSTGAHSEDLTPRVGRRSAWSTVGAGAAPELSEIPAPGAVEMDEEGRAEVHQIAQLHDAQALAEPMILESYAIQAPLGSRPDIDGECYVVVGGETEVPQALAGVEWAVDGVITYEVAWSPVDDIQLHREFPSAEHRVARARVGPFISAVTYVLHQAANGEVIDMDGFLVAAEDLI